MTCRTAYSVNFRSAVFLSMFIFLAAFSWFMPQFARARDQTQAQQENPPERVARISFAKGKVSFQPAGQDVWSEPTRNFTVTSGDRLYTDQGARAELEMGTCTVRVSEQTDLVVTNLTDQLTQLGLEQGTLRLTVYQVPSGQTVEIDTPNSSLTIIEPGTYRAEVDPDGNVTTVRVNSGRLDISAQDVTQPLSPGEAVRIVGQTSVHIDSIPMPSQDSFDQWCEQRDQHVKSSPSAKYVSRGAVGFSDLDDYGYWQDTTDYGPVWYPNDVPLDWVPYRYGHWAWIDSWGWTWIDDDAWGFCPFHYGRWVFINSVWGWVPGPYVVFPVYTPALVAFIGGPGFAINIGAGPVELAAWFPLGPAEPFFPWYHCTFECLRLVNVTNVRVTNITNIINIRDISQIHYAYRDTGTTAVPANVFSSGQPVMGRVVRLSPQLLGRAQVVPHPAVNPTQRAALPGRPVVPPPIRRPVPVAAHNAAGGGVRTAPGVTRTPPSVVARNRTPIEGAGRAPVPPPRALPPRTMGPTVPAPRTFTPRPGSAELFSKTPPPPPRVPFSVQRPAMAAHPGRPLEPQQLDNLEMDRPAGPMRDEEFPAHVAPVVPERSIVQPARVIPATPRPHRP